MAKLDIYEPLLVPPNMQPEVSWFQIVQQVRSFVDHDVAVPVFGLVGGPPDVRKIAREAVTGHDDVIRLETKITV